MADLTDNDIAIAARLAGFTDKQWRAMFFEVGPYDITRATTQLEAFVKRVREMQPLNSGERK